MLIDINNIDFICVKFGFKRAFAFTLFERDCCCKARRTYFYHWLIKLYHDNMELIIVLDFEFSSIL